MARSHKSTVAKKPREKAVALPAHLLQAPLLHRTKVPPGRLAKYQQQVLLLFTPTLLPATMKALYKLVERGDYRAIELCCQLFGLVKAPGGLTINNTMVANNMAGVMADSRGFDSIARDLQAQQQVYELPVVNPGEAQAPQA